MPFQEQGQEVSTDLDPEWTQATGYSWRRIGAVIEIRVSGVPEPVVPQFELPTVASEGGGAVVEEPGSTRSTAERDVSRNPTDHESAFTHTDADGSRLRHEFFSTPASEPLCFACGKPKNDHPGGE